MIRRRSARKPGGAPPSQRSPPSKRSISFSVAFPLPAPGTPPAAKRRPLRTQHLGVAAVDAGYCCHEATQLHLSVEWRLDRHVVAGVLENATGQPLFEVREKPLSLHRQRTLLGATDVPVATIRMSAFRRRKISFSAYPRAETSRTPLFKFTVTRSQLEMTFADIMTGEVCRLGTAGEQADIEIWLQRGASEQTARQPIAHMYPASAGTPLGYSLDIAEGVDAVMAILVCIAVHDSEPERTWRSPSALF
ncbi:Tubby C-terminal-like domain [Phytophthora cinnamomi]|uniref:Tubby C-terminal-like domain n=1 Tax=Phytophthora cinnamomi TaxID=4785 RepID=UPI00355954A7|nr:Tubby C-terminal-like domain [Phytophthora cinnamomi]